MIFIANHVSFTITRGYIVVGRRVVR